MFSKEKPFSDLDSLRKLRIEEILRKPKNTNKMNPTFSLKKFKSNNNLGLASKRNVFGNILSLK